MGNRIVFRSMTGNTECNDPDVEYSCKPVRHFNEPQTLVCKGGGSTNTCLWHMWRQS